MCYLGIDAALSKIAEAYVDKKGNLLGVQVKKLKSTGNKSVNRLRDVLGCQYKYYSFGDINPPGDIKVAIETTVAWSSPNVSSISQCAFVSGYLAGLYEAKDYVSRLEIVAPNEWKGREKKEKTVKDINERFRDTKSWALLNEMITNLPNSLVHDVYDAIGIALWLRDKHEE